MSRPSHVTVTEVGPRDGFQMESEFIPTESKIELVNRLIAAGVPRIEFSSFVSPRAIPQLRDAAEVLAGLDRTGGTILAALVPNKLGAIRAAQAGVDEMVVFVSASESHNRKNVNCTTDQSLDGFADVVTIARDAGIPVNGAIATALGCPFEGDVPLERLGYITGRFRDLGICGVGLGDTTGMATPPIVTASCRYLRQHYPDMPIALHFHNTRGLGLVNVMAGLDEGINAFDASFGGLGGCPFAPKATGNICTEDLVYMLKEMGIETGIDLDQLCDVAGRVETVVGRTLPGQVMKAGERLALHAMDDVGTATG